MNRAVAGLWCGKDELFGLRATERNNQTRPRDFVGPHRWPIPGRFAKRPT